jgi:glycosyltransferase involved in cell wall biosynthesis
MYDFFSEPGGIERVMIFQAKALRKAGYNVRFAFAYVDEELKRKMLSGFEVIEYSKLPFNARNETLQICSSLLRNNFLSKLRDTDLVICHSFPSSYVAYRLFKKYNIPYIQFLHHHPQFLYFQKLDWASNTSKRKLAFFVGKFFGHYPRYLDKKCLTNAKKIMVNSLMVQKIIQKIYNRKGNIHYPAVDSVFFTKPEKLSALKKLGIPKNFILASGRIVRLKRFDYLIESYAKLPEKIKKNLHLVFAGKEDRAEKEALVRLAKHLNVRNIRFLGPLDKKELHALYAAAKLTVLTCPGEYFGLVPVESMASGTPVVSWKDNAGPQETILDGETGYLVKPYSTVDMSDKIHKTLSKKWNRNKIRAHARKFSEPVLEKKFISEISTVLPNQ